MSLETDKLTRLPAVLERSHFAHAAAVATSYSLNARSRKVRSVARLMRWLASHVLTKAVERAKIEGGEVEDVILGCGLPEGATGHNVARNAALAAFGIGVPGAVLNRYCGSGISAASEIASRIATGEIAVGIAGGVESIMRRRCCS